MVGLLDKVIGSRAPNDDSIAVSQFVRFVWVGLIATVIHFAILWFAMNVIGVHLIAATCAGFIVAAIASYFLNYTYTYQSTANHYGALPKFIAIAGFGGVLNLFCVYITAIELSIHYLVAQVIATAVVTLWNFLANRAWTFR